MVVEFPWAPLVWHAFSFFTSLLVTSPVLRTLLMYFVLFHKPLCFFGINTTHTKHPPIALEGACFQHGLPLLI